MAQPHKGAREQILAPVAEVVAARLKQIQLEYGISSVSQFAADLLAIALGQRHAVRELDQQVLPLLAGAPAGCPHSASRVYIKVRVVDAVAGRLRALATDHATNPSQASADLLAIAVGRPELVRDLNKEVMPLAM